MINSNLINEVICESTYQGKSKNLMEAEKYLAVIIKKLKSFEYPSKEFYKYNPNNSKEIEKVKQCFAKEFGFAELDLNLDSRPIINGYTYISYGLITLINTSMPKLPLKKGEKYYDSSHNYYCYINIFTAMIVELDLTPGELMAIILHEIGHNFDVSIPSVIARKAAIVLTLLEGAPYRLLLMDISAYMAAITDKIITSASHYVPDAMKLYAKFCMLMDDFSSIFADLRIVGDIIKSVMRDGVSNFIIGSAIGGAGEVFADSFAVSYGYGKETVSAMDKLSNIHYTRRFKYRDKVMHVKGINTLIDANNTIIKLAVAIIDPHPQSETRMIFAIKRLEELSQDTSLTPTQRKIIKNDLEAAKKIREANMAMGEEKERGMYASMLRKYLLDKTDGALDIKAFLLRLLPYSEA